MKRYNGEDGSQVEMDAMEAANKSEEAMDIADSMSRGAAGTSETVKAKPKAMPKAAPKAAPKVESKPAAKAAPADETKLSLSDRMKLSRERARSGSATDTRSVGERLRAAFAGKNRGGNSVDFGGSGMGMKKGGAVKKMASGGMTSSSASKRADGIAVKGKTRGKMC
jgi:hypothetical protein